MSKTKVIQRAKGRGRRYIFHDSINPGARTFLVYYYNNENVILTTDGPFTEELRAFQRMKELLLKGYCAWVVSYNE